MTLRSILAATRRILDTPVWGTVRPRAATAKKSATTAKNRERGFVYLLALFAIMVMIAGSLAILQKGAVQHRRAREEEMIWRGNQYVRAIRMYYHKTGHYPQTLDDLNKGMPQLHFLRQAYKDPTNAADGSWRFIYINAAGQIIGSVKYANLQQMALMDQNGGKLPVIPGQPGQSVGSIVAQQQGIDPNTGQPLNANGQNGANGQYGNGQSMNANNNQPPVYNSDGSLAQTTTNAFGNQIAVPTADPNAPPPTSATNNNPNLPAGLPANLANITPQQIQDALQSGQLPAGITQADVQNFLATGQIPAGLDPSVVAAVQQAIAASQNGGAAQGALPGANPNNPGASQGAMFGGLSGQPGIANAANALGAGGLAGAAGLVGAALGGGQMNLAALAALKPTGAVDGPVLGAFLTGVAGKTDAGSVKNYRGAKKLKEFEFIWNPLEDAAAALQNQTGNGQGNVLGQGTSSTSPNGTSNGSSSFSNTFGNQPSQGPQQNSPQQNSPQQ